MRNLKKLLSLLLAVMMVVSMAACAGNPSTDTNPTENGAEQTAPSAGTGDASIVIGVPSLGAEQLDYSVTTSSTTNENLARLLYILIALSLSVVLGTGSGTVVFVLGITSWANYAKVVRVETMRLKNQEFVTLAKLSGAKTSRVFLRHILPNLVNTIIVMATLQLGMAIILSASLSFLGLGAAAPSSEWGLMMSEGRDYITSAWWLTTVPGIAIFLTVLSVNTLGNTLRIKLDPKTMVTR